MEADASGRLLNWAIELSEFDIEYRPRIVIKGQVLADCIVEGRTPIPRRLESTNGCWRWMDHPRPKVEALE